MSVLKAIEDAILEMRAAGKDPIEIWMSPIAYTVARKELWDTVGHTETYPSRMCGLTIRITHCIQQGAMYLLTKEMIKNVEQQLAAL